jgi:hypothetical protein
MTALSTLLAVVLAVFFLGLGTAKLLAVAPMRKAAAHFGLPTNAYRSLGALEIAGAMGLLLGLALPVIGALAGVGLLLLLVGALVSHVRVGDRLQDASAAIVVGMLVVIMLAVQW